MINKNKLTLFYCLLWLVLVLPLAACSQAPSSTTAAPPSSSPQGNGSSYPVSITNYDAAENPVPYSYKKAPERVVITHPGATELFLELGLEDHILSTVAPYGAPLGRLAAKYTKLTIMKAPYTPAQEELMEMQPDLIIGWEHHFRPTEIGDINSWHERGVATYIMPSTLTKIKPTLDNVIYAFITDIGQIFDIQNKASQYIEHAKQRVAHIEEAIKDVPQKKSVIILQDYNNGTFSLYGSNYLINNMVVIAGGKNISEDQASFVGAEKVLSFDPDFIIFVPFSNSSIDLTDEQAAAQLKAIEALESMRAIRESNIINLPFFTVHNGGIRTIDAIEKIAKNLYPERFKKDADR